VGARVIDLLLLKFRRLKGFLKKGFKVWHGINIPSLENTTQQQQLIIQMMAVCEQ
jgi:hypothetical protein